MSVNYQSSVKEYESMKTIPPPETSFLTSSVSVSVSEGVERTKRSDFEQPSWLCFAETFSTWS